MIIFNKVRKAFALNMEHVKDWWDASDWADIAYQTYEFGDDIWKWYWLGHEELGALDAGCWQRLHALYGDDAEAMKAEAEKRGLDFEAFAEAIYEEQFIIKEEDRHLSDDELKALGYCDRAIKDRGWRGLN